MTQTTQSASDSLVRMKTSSSSENLGFFGAVGAEAVSATNMQHCQVIELNDYRVDATQVPTNYTAVSALVRKWEGDDAKKAALEKAREWVADTFYNEDGDTVRAIRLRKGWSQTRLASELSTSQPHVARIESGTENLALGTCRRLCDALQLDMNTLDQALRRQEAINQAGK